MWLFIWLCVLQFPLLLPGQDEFVYESCTPLNGSSGSVEGSFTFVPGRYDLIHKRSFNRENEVILSGICSQKTCVC